ncbi:uncharacterized protein LOC122291737 [Carya illinoinensis]|uniref:DC1 domain-containing protein n=1 Tax=Carya illinoinensis TaxID=32201 RepID=A0A8T1NL09_CARIL|nr:uncharacterized protein LOC122291737 [Carya illinoinensis]XP_042955602.1 uncharacterized protein LOC122291737 [Carya illinoinensis]XP_042955603.1 uncharacterized protein LOC122291737 [Carya illinoinensis]XP_042955604.1 uncharacterized protein LOC122291737 [Carya illinoinensis]KAG6632279.1 hypothetical protein CIPAW_13G148100 [Carya illinoinensis]
MEIQYFNHEHPLVFIEGVGENEVIVCRGCDEPILDAAYKCSQYCSFFLHKSCTELQREIQNPVHPNHPLVLIALERRRCDCCRKSSKRCFVYHCKECGFDLDIKCASNLQSRTAEDGHRHVFTPILKHIQFTCDICGEDRKDCARVCTICQLLVDGFCAQLACTVEIAAHKDHFLTLIYSLHHQVKEQDDQILCQLCYKTVNTKYGAYYCKICDFVAHLKCAKRNSLQQFDNLDASVYPQYLSMDSVDFATNVIKEISLEEDEGTQDILAEHPFVGRHNFILTDKKLEDDKLCAVCMQLILGSFYSCATCSGKCNIFIHDRCRNLPIKKQHLLHLHPLTLSLGNRYIGGTFHCRVCQHLRHGFRYRCDECNYDLNIHCSSIPNIVKHEGHQHSLRLAIRPLDEICNGCDSRMNTRGKFVCIEPECNFALGFECAILPLVVKYEYDRHGLLKLTYSVEDDSGEYYCFICEKERNPKQWFYYCGECDFVAHPKCIIGKYPYIKYGSTFRFHPHQHLLTFVRKMQFSLPCDSCNEPFEGLGIECKQCEFIVYPSMRCDGKYSI